MMRGETVATLCVNECIFTLHCSNRPLVPSLFIILKSTICRYSGSVLALIITANFHSLYNWREIGIL
jgi:hypothetical protein